MKTLFLIFYSPVSVPNLMFRHPYDLIPFYYNHTAKLLIHNANTVLVLVDGLVSSPLTVDEAPWHQTAHKQRNA